MVNDLIVKKRFRPDFKKIVLDEKLNNEEKINEMNDEYKDIFEEMEEILNFTPLSALPQGGGMSEGQGGVSEENIDKLKKLVDL
ncbi:MAG: hypothetical protein LBF15_00545 [Candidatus Peribacteria bacterium]|nr:hypothetical protein [Candidatus Peribacteria bacterium]